MVGHRGLTSDDVPNGHGREARPVGRPGRRVGRGWAGRTLAAAEHVDAHQEIPVGIKTTARSDHPVPPARGRLAGSTFSEGVSVAGQRVTDQDRVVSRRREFAPGFVGHGDVAEDVTALEHERPLGGQFDKPAVTLGVAGPPGAGDWEVLRVAARMTGQVDRVEPSVARRVASHVSSAGTNHRARNRQLGRRAPTGHFVAPVRRPHPHPLPDGRAPWVSVPGCRTRKTGPLVMSKGSLRFGGPPATSCSGAATLGRRVPFPPPGHQRVGVLTVGPTHQHSERPPGVR